MKLVQRGHIQTTLVPLLLAGAIAGYLSAGYFHLSREVGGLAGTGATLVALIVLEMVSSLGGEAIERSSARRRIRKWLNAGSGAGLLLAREVCWSEGCLSSGRLGGFAGEYRRFQAMGIDTAGQRLALAGDGTLKLFARPDILHWRADAADAVLHERTSGAHWFVIELLPQDGATKSEDIQPVSRLAMKARSASQAAALRAALQETLGAPA